MLKEQVNNYTDFVRGQKYMSGVERNSYRIKATAEVFTPTKAVQEVLSKFPKESFSENQEFLDPACGDGQFLSEIVIEKLNISDFSLEEILKETFGIDIMKDNIDLCIKRLAGPEPNEEILKILKENIICADALNKDHKGWHGVGYMWDENSKY